MKICGKCGAHNDNSRQFCIDCSHRLGDKLTPEEEQKMHARFQKKLDKMGHQTDPLYVSPWDKVMGVIAIIGALVCAVLFVMRLMTWRGFYDVGMGLLCFGLAAIEALVPRMTWALEQIRLGFLIGNADDAEPGDFYRISRKVTIVLLVVLGVLVLVKNLMYWR